MTKRDHDLLEWTVADAPVEAEAWPEPAAPLPLRPRHAALRRWELPRRAWVMLATATLLAVLVAAFGLPWLEQNRTRRAVEQVIALETAAIRAGEWETLRTYYDADERAWVSNEIEAIKYGGRSVVLLPYSAWSPNPEGELRWVRVLAPELAQAEIVRSYPLGDGTTATLAVPQFYRYAEGAWVHTPPPDDWWGETRQWQGTHVDLEYRAVDAAHAAEVGPYLDGLAAQACERWQCAAGLRVPVEVVPSLGGTNLRYWGYSRISSLMFGLLASGARPGTLVPLAVASPHIAGHPQDEATLALTRRPIAIQVLLRIAQQHWPGSNDHGSIFFYALLARELTRLGLEAPDLTQRRVANPLYSLEQLWSMRSTGFPADQALTQALVMLNHLLDGQPPAAEAALLQTVHSASDAAAWLAAGLDLRPALVEARLAAAQNPPVPLASNSGWDKADMAVSCLDELRLASTDGETWPLLEGQHPNSGILAWSPDGRRLAITISGRPALLDLAQGTGTWLPEPMAEFATVLQWVGDSLVAYEAVTATPADLPDQYLTNSQGIHFYDAADPGRRLALPSALRIYQLSPDRAWAVATLTGIRPELVIIPALGGEPVVIGAGSLAQWSPDSRQVAFMDQDNSGRRWSLRLADAATGEYRILLAADDPRVPVLDLGPEPAWVQFAWSPRGDEIAVFMQHYDGLHSEGWVGLLALGDLDFRLLATPESGLSLLGASYSADGRTLKVGLGASVFERRTALYDAASAAWLRTLPAKTSASWSGTGNELLLINATGTYLAADLRNPAVQPQRLLAESCANVQWRPH